MSDRRAYLNLGAVHRWELFVAAGELVGPAEPRGPALVVAQAAVEVGVEKAIDFALQLRGVYDPLAVWVLEESIYSWSPHNKRVQRLWKALTSDVLSDAPSLGQLCNGASAAARFCTPGRSRVRTGGQSSSPPPKSSWVT